MNLNETSLAAINERLDGDPEALVRWAVGLGERAVITTSFGPYAAVLLHLVTQHAPQIPVVWMDSGYATPATYRFVDEAQRRLNLNLRIYHPLRSRAHREAVDGAPPSLDDPRHEAFTREVKLEPFERAMRELNPTVWFTGVRADETSLRAKMQPVSLNSDGLIKVAPVLGWSSKQMWDYLKRHDLPNNFDYADPTKVEDKRECGLHVEH